MQKARLNAAGRLLSWVGGSSPPGASRFWGGCAGHQEREQEVSRSLAYCFPAGEDTARHTLAQLDSFSSTNPNEGVQSHGNTQRHGRR
jgi:hypothetical protein